MPNVIGSFVFRNEGDGCLSSKYINRGMPSPLMECSKTIGNLTPDDLYSGRYDSIWLEGGNQTNSSILNAQRNQDGIYILTWTLNGNDIFGGQGMLFENLLVGCYWSSDLQGTMPT